MRSHAAYQPITVEQFLDIDFGTDRKYELIDGVIEMMTGGTPAHSRVAVNILAFLHRKLRGTGCRAYNADMGLRVDDVNCRYPDVSIYCGDPASREREQAERIYSDPVVLFEVLSPSTSKIDRVDKLEQYRSIASVDTIIFVDPERELSRVIQRLGPTSWRDDLFAQPHDIDLPALNLSIPHDEIFARD
ncbi:Endonuclease, Uma2 family (restriction endonuclease fold) [Sphingomonas palmae]|uniref:Endonuclease, Uma2 family (Restriction endonuclease fold) n=1 Tax=Sphingomonas palmae TaxID=1855283 RepID=A0A1H7HZQ7_9SPHN|nr:Uma2 family endonuclease [Sphingomonas palmae]SEK53715.1 Endonuclease, Uma2 family (restriction endonuclease fold) [Sphingomonas palmae]